MSLMEFLESLFCTKCHSKILNLEADNHELTEEKQILTRNYQNLMMEKLQLILNCGKETLELNTKIRELETIIKQLEQLDLESFNWTHIESYPLIDYDVSNISAFREVMFIRADARYNLFSKEDWTRILSEVYPLVKEALTRWSVDISDCDNWSTVMSAFVSIAFKKSGYGMQGAFAIAHTVNEEPSRHAYNLFVDDKFNVWLYEPQTNKIVGSLENGVGIYNTGYVLFLN